MVDGETGFIVNPYDEGSIVDRTLRILRDDGSRRALGEAGQRRVKDRYSVERMAAAYEEVYQCG